METEVTEIDISPDMLEKAKNIRKHNLQNKNVIMMNGEQPHLRIILLIKLLGCCGFGDTEPNLLIKEMKSCKPNGDIYLVNHFSLRLIVNL